MVLIISLTTLNPKISVDNGFEIFVNKSFWFHLGNTFNEEDFDTMIFAAIKEREQYIVTKNKMEINWDPKIAEALFNSKFISSRVLHYLMFYSC